MNSSGQYFRVKDVYNNMDANTKRAVIMIGIQGSGKNEYVRQFLLPKGYIHISLDILHTRRKEKLLLEQCLAEGRSFVIGA